VQLSLLLFGLFVTAIVAEPAHSQPESGQRFTGLLGYAPVTSVQTKRRDDFSVVTMREVTGGCVRSFSHGRIALMEAFS